MSTPKPSRALKAVRYARAADRDRATADIVAEVARRAVLLSAPQLASTPAVLRRGDGSSAFRPHRGERYTSRQLLDAEARLLTAGRDRTGPALDPALLDRGAAEHLMEDQQTAVASVATSGRVVDVLVGPAGSGKTRSLSALRTAWEHSTVRTASSAWPRPPPRPTSSAKRSAFRRRTPPSGLSNTTAKATGCTASSAPAPPCTPPPARRRNAPSPRI